ncbi:hypothetical protein [Desulfurobacterium sp.]
MKSCVIVAFLLIFSFSTGRADPQIFGFKLGKATYSQMAEKLEMKQITSLPGINARVYSVNPRDLKVKDVERITVIFTPDGIFSGALMVYPGGCFNSVYRRLLGKFRVVYARLPVVGTRYVRFVDGNTIIILKKPYQKYITTVIYIQKSLLGTFR